MKFTAYLGLFTKSMACASFALSISAPIARAAEPLGFDHARHLLNRTSFAASTAEINAFAALTPEAAIDQLLSSRVVIAKTPVPEWGNSYERVFKPTMTQEERQLANRKELVVKGLELRAWWMTEMLATGSPFTEKMTLFWHNHFATGQEKVRPATLMLRQNKILRKHALGNFGALLRDISKDPAMLTYLDQAQSRKGTPNENFAREVMELFTLGEGHYSEQDIKEAARALTGWSVNIDTGEFLYRPGAHDGGSKTIFGKTGNFSGDDFITMLLQRPEVAEHIVAKLMREFVSPTPEPTEVKRLAALFRSANYELAPLMRAMLTAPSFYAPEMRATLVKSPVDLVVGTLRQFKFEVHDAAPFAVLTRQLGQDLFQPPNVKGWPGGEVWINTNTLLARKGFLNRLFRENEMSGPLPSPFDKDMAVTDTGRARAQARQAMRPEQRGNLAGQYHFDSRRFLGDFSGNANMMADDTLTRTVLAGAPVQVEKAEPTLAGLRALVLDPIYQLK
jgi:uncharacterized protein (DUF1800 family)